MTSIRPEVLAFLRAAQALLSSEEAEGNLRLSDEESDSLAEVVTQLNKLLQDSEVLPDSDGPP